MTVLVLVNILNAALIPLIAYILHFIIKNDNNNISHTCWMFNACYWQLKSQIPTRMNARTSAKSQPLLMIVYTK